MRVESGGSLGDEVALTGALRAYRATFPSERIALTVRHPEVFETLSWLEAAEDNGAVYRLRLGGDRYDREHLVIDYGGQMGVNVFDTKPEIALGAYELASGAGVVAAYAGRSKTLTIDTWAGWPSRRYSRWEAVVDYLLTLAPDLCVIEVGASVPDCDGRTRGDVRLRRASAQLVDLFSVRETASIIAWSNLYVGSDSGLAHVAAAVGTPQVVLYGPKPWWTRAYSTTCWVVPEYACECDEHCSRGCVDSIPPLRVASAIAARLGL